MLSLIYGSQCYQNTFEACITLLQGNLNVFRLKGHLTKYWSTKDFDFMFVCLFVVDFLS